MDQAIMHYDIICEMVNGKIEDIHADYGDELDSDELDDLYKCVKIKAKLAKIKHLEHDARKGMVSGTIIKHITEKTV